MAKANPIKVLPRLGITRKANGWFFSIAIMFILLGILAIVEPRIAGLAVIILVAWLLILGGVAHLIEAFSTGGAGRVIWQVIVGVIYIMGGIHFRTHPLLGLGTLTLLLGGIILAEAVLKFIEYFRRRAENCSRWILANGLISLLLGALIWFHWPSSSVWAIGTLLGVNLLMAGISRLILGMARSKPASRADLALSSFMR